MLSYFAGGEMNFLLPSGFLSSKVNNDCPGGRVGTQDLVFISLTFSIVPGTTEVFSNVHCFAKFAFLFLDIHLQMEGISETTSENRYSNLSAPCVNPSVYLLDSQRVCGLFSSLFYFSYNLIFS